MKIKYDIIPCPFKKGMWVTPKDFSWKSFNLIDAYQVYSIDMNKRKVLLVVAGKKYEDNSFTFDYFIEVPSDKPEIYKYED